MTEMGDSPKNEQRSSVNHKQTANTIISMPSSVEPVEKVHVQQSTVVTPHNTYVREIFQNEGKKCNYLFLAYAFLWN